MAQREPEERTGQVAATVPTRSPGGQPPFGYRRDGNKLVPDPTEASVRKLIYELFLEHRRKKTVARLLNEAGHRTRSGAKFSDTTVERLLRNPTAKGVGRAEGIEVEPIVATERWDQCNQILDEQKKTGKRPARKAAHLFTGYVFCGCGTNMYVPSNSPKYICPACRRKIPTGDLEAIFREQLKGFRFSADEVDGHLDEADRQALEKQSLVQSLLDEQRKLKREMDRLVQLHAAEQIQTEQFGRLYRPLEERLKQIEDQVPALQADVDFAEIRRLSGDQPAREIQDLHARWPKLDDDAKRRIVENLTEKITVDERDVTVELCALPSPPDGERHGAR